MQIDLNVRVFLDKDTTALIASIASGVGDVKQSISTLTQEFRTMATISDQALADLQAAAAANVARDNELSAKVDAAVQLIADLKAAIAGAGTNADAAVAAITTLLNSGAATDLTNAGKLDAAVAP